MLLEADQYVKDTFKRARLSTRSRRKRLPDPKVGDRSGKLTVVKFNPVSRYCECYCDCGATTYVEARFIKQCITKSCGCSRSRTAPLTRDG